MAEHGTDPVPALPDGARSSRDPGWRRAVAWAVDAVAVYVISALTVIATMNFGENRRYITGRSSGASNLSGGISILYLLLPLVIWHRSFGKATVGLVVERLDGSPLTTRDALVRSAVALAPFWVALLPWPDSWGVTVGSGCLALIVVILASNWWGGPEHRGLPDRAAGTVVRRIA